MKKIINGKLYDTDTAKSLGYAYHGSSNDFAYWCETLYKKRTGEFFLHGEGGPHSRYAVSQSENTWGGGEKIIPLSYKAAQEWAIQHLDADEYQEIFGEVTEGDDVLISIKLPAATDSKLRRIAAEKGISLTALIIDLIDNA